MTEQELLRALTADDAEFNRIFEYSFKLREAAGLFPAHADALIQKVLNSDVAFKRHMVFTVNHLMTLQKNLEAFPTHAEAIKSKFITFTLGSSDAEFKQIITSDVGLRVVAAQYSAHADALIQRVLNSDVEFKRLMMFTMTLQENLEAFPTHAEAIKSKFITFTLGSSEAEFKEIIMSAVWLREAARLFPAHADALIQRVLNDPSIFDRIVRNDKNLVDFKQLCKDVFAIHRPVSEEEDQNRDGILLALEKPTLVEARAALKEEMLAQRRETIENRVRFFKNSSGERMSKKIYPPGKLVGHFIVGDPHKKPEGPKK